jgi:hypothetical protein
MKVSKKQIVALSIATVTIGASIGAIVDDMRRAPSPKQQILNISGNINIDLENDAWCHRHLRCKCSTLNVLYTLILPYWPHPLDTRRIELKFKIAMTLYYLASVINELVLFNSLRPHLVKST